VAILTSSFVLKLAIAVSHFVAKSRFQYFPNLMIRSLLKFKEHLKSATKIALLILIRVFFQKLAFCTCLLM